MNKYLIDLFKDENTVIIPGLGALTVVNRATNELMFMSYLKHNDGTLIKYIAQQDGIDTDAAQDKVSRFVDEVKAMLDNGGVFELEQIGTFSKDNSGDIQYDSVVSEILEDKKESSEEVKTEIVPSIDVIEEDIQNVSEEISETVERLNDEVSETIESKELEVEKEEPVTEIKEEKEIVEEAEQEEFVLPIPEVNELSSEEPAIVPISEDEQWNDDLDLPPLNYQPERSKKPILEKTKKDKKPRRNGTLWLILIALLVVGGSAYVGLNYNELKEKIPFLASSKAQEEDDLPDDLNSELTFQEEVEDVIDEENSDRDEITEEFVEEPVTSAEPTAQPKETRPASVVPSSGLIVNKSLPIQVIVGSFGEESNAVRLVEKLRTEGFPAEVIGVYGGLHTVSVASFDSMDEYRANQSQLQSAGAHWVKR